MAQGPVPADSKKSYDVAFEVFEERRRQVFEERHSVDHDDLINPAGQMAIAAGVYASVAGMNDGNRNYYPPGSTPPIQWPWGREHWKPTSRRRDLIKAGALIIAEIERLDRRG